MQPAQAQQQKPSETCIFRVIAAPQGRSEEYLKMIFLHCVNIDFDQNGTLPRAPEDHLKRPQDRPGTPQHTSRLPQEAFLVLSEVLKIAKTFGNTCFPRFSRFVAFLTLQIL